MDVDGGLQSSAEAFAEQSRRTCHLLAPLTTKATDDG